MKIIIAVVLTVMGCFIFAEHTFASDDDYYYEEMIKLERKLKESQREAEAAQREAEYQRDRAEAERKAHNY